jgi:hypothetical protein
MSAILSNASDEPRALAYNFTQVKMLQTALSRAESNLSTIPGLVGRIIRDACWRDWKTPEDARVRWNAADFRVFLTAKRPEGCETPIHVIDRILRGTDAWEAYQELIRGERGGANNPSPVQEPITGRFTPTVNRYPVTVDGNTPDVIASLPVKTRDYSREAPTGNSTSYNVRRLSKERPDLYERVKAGELKPKTAMREAGLITPEFSIPVEPQGAARRILNRFEGEPLLELARVLANHAGYELRKRE